MTIDEVITMLNSEDCKLTTDICLMRYKVRDCWKCILEEYTKTVYNKAIDDFAEKISLEISESLIWGMIADCFKYKNLNDTSDKIVDYVINTANEIAEQLKAGGENDKSI